LQVLNTLDYGFIAVYLLVLVLLGLYLSRKASASLEDYFLGGRKLPWWALGVSGMASNLDMTGTMLIVSFLYMLGPRGLFIEFRGGAVLIMAVMMLWTGKWHRRSNCMTGAEWMVYRFGEGVGGQFARIVSALSVLIWLFGALAYMIKGTGIFLAHFLPFSPMTCAVIMIGVATLYTMVSGFYGVVYTDLFQSGIILVAVIVVVVLATTAISTSDVPLATAAWNATHSEQWMSGAPHWRTNMPPGGEYQPYQLLFLFAFFYLVKNVIHGMGLGGDPKYFGARSERECGTLSFLWTVLLMFRWPMMMGIAVLGVFLVGSLFPDQSALAQSAALIKTHLGDIPQALWGERIFALAHHPEAHSPELVAGLQSILGEQWKEKLVMVSHDGAINPETILPSVLLFDIPMGFRGMMVVAFVAAAMSTFDSSVNGGAAYFTRDIYQRYFRPTASNRELMLATYACILLVVLGGFGMALGAKSINDIWAWLIMGFGAGLLVPGTLKFYWWRFNATGVVVGTLFGLTAAVLDRIFPQIGVFMRTTFFYEGFPQELAGFIYLAGIGLIGSILGTYLGKPTDAKALEHFYRTTRPFGVWGPLKRRLGPQTRAAVTREHVNDLAALPFALGWQIAMFLLPMLLLIRNWTGAAVTAVLFLGCLIGLYFFWYRNLPPASAGVQDNIDTSR
jgi:Na+/proline symporter